MDNKIEVSFATLVKGNNGFFKSEKQASFLLSNCQDGMTFTTAGNVYGNSFNMIYHCDNQGVVTVEKYLPKTGRTEVVFMRHIEGCINQVETAAKAKEVKRIKREIKMLEKSIAERNAAYALGQYADCEELYTDANGRDVLAVEEYKGKLDSIQ